jgi:hypothetical protein
MNGLLGGLADTACLDWARGYFVPGVPKGTADDDKFIFDLPGGDRALDVDHVMSGVDVLSDADLADLSDTTKEPIDRDRLVKFAQRLSRATSEHRAWMGELLKKVLKGEPFADKGQRDNTAYKLAQDLGKAFPEADAGSIAEVFTPSLSQMGKDAPTLENIRDKIRRAQREVLATRHRDQRKQQLKEKQLKEKTGFFEYDKGYIERFCERTKSGSTYELFQERLIVQRGNKFFVFSQGNYIPFTEREVANACRDLLKPAAANLRVNIYNVSDKGLETPKSAAQLVHEYGVVAHKEQLRLYEQCSYYEERTHTMVQAPCPIRELKPQKSEAVERWIDAVCGTEVSMGEALRDWLALVPDLRRALAFLMFVGDTGVGKTQFANGIARLWSMEGCVAMSHAFDPFNVEITTCPVLLADEALPMDFRGRVPTDKIRSLISSSSHAINAKNQAVVKLRGFFRLIAAVNNRDKLNFGQAHSREDIAAIQRRTLIIPVQPGASALFDFDHFVTEDGLARHSLWLQENREVSESRFGVDASSVTHVLDLVRDTTTESVLEWILWFLENRRLEEDHELPAFVLGEEFFINPDLLHKHWGTCFTGKEDRRPTKVKLREVVGIIKKGKGIRVRLSSGARRQYSQVDREILFKYIYRERLDKEHYELQLQCFTQKLFDNPYVKLPVEYRKPTAHQRERRRFAEKQLQALKDAAPDGEDEDEELDHAQEAE